MRIRYGMVGGGPGAFIGAVHRMAAALDGEYEMVAGAFSADPARSAETGSELRLDSSRVYDSYEEMAEVLGCEMGTVKSRLHRGRRQFEELFRRWELGETEGSAE